MDALEAALDKHLNFELVRSAGSLYATLPKGNVVEGSIVETRLSS